MNDIKCLLGKRIKELRKQKSLTQEQLAEILGIDQRTLSAIECGTNFPTKNFIKIAQVFNISIKDLFDFSHIEKNEETKKQEIMTILDTLNNHDLNIIYRLVKSMN